MANYNVDIAVAIKNAQALKKFNKDVKQTSNFVDDINLKIRRSSNAYEKSLNTLSSSLQKTKVNINKAAVGTDAFRKSALDLVRAEKSLNKELALKNKLLEQLRKNEDQFGVAQSSSSNRVRRNVAASAKSRIDPKFKSLSLLGQTSPVGEKLERTLALKRDEIRLQEALLSLEQRSAAKQNEKLQIQGELNRQTAQAVNDLKLRGQFSPLTSDVRGNIFDVKSRIEENTLASRRAKFRNVFSGVSGRDFGQIGGRIGPVEPIRSEGGFLAFSKSADKIAAGVKANVKQTTKTASILSQQATRAAFEGMPFGVKDGQIGPAAAPTFFNRMGFGKNAQAGPFAMQGGAMGRLKGGVGSAMIGGGFPFLFGAGGLSAAMGGIAGGIGGALAPGGGFALSIAATAIAAQIEDAIKFRKELKKLNAQITAVGGNSEFSRKEIKQFAKELGQTKEEVIEALDAFIPRFEQPMAEMLLKTLGTPEQFDALAGITDSASLIDEIVKSRDIIGQTKADELLADLKLGKSLDVQLKLTKEIARVRREQLLKTQAEELDISDKNFQKLMLQEDNLQRFLGQIDPDSQLGKIFKDIDPKQIDSFKQLEMQVGFGTLGTNLKLFKKEFFGMLNQEELAKFDEAAEKTAKLVEFGREYALQLQEFEEFRAPVDEIERLSRATRIVLDVSKELKTSFAESFKGIVKGTMTVTDAFRNMLNRIGDYFLDLAAQVLAAGIQKSFLGLFQNMFNIQMPAIDGAMANGGRVRGGGTYLVGERGAELFTPGVSGTITPNESLGGSTNIVVNVDASGTSVEGNEANGEELGRLIGAVVQSELIKEKRPGGLLA